MNAAQKTYERLLTCAASLFDREGYAQVSVDDICREAGVSRSTFYNHFSGKEELCFSFYTSPQIYSPARMAWVVSGQTPIERLVRAHMCYLRHPTVRCAPDVYLARCQFLISHTGMEALAAENYPNDLFLPFAEQARAAGELLAEGDLLPRVTAFSTFQFGWDITWTLAQHSMPYAPSFAEGMSLIYQIRPDVPLAQYIEDCLKP